MNILFDLRKHEDIWKVSIISTDGEILDEYSAKTSRECLPWFLSYMKSQFSSLAQDVKNTLQFKRENK